MTDAIAIQTILGVVIGLIVVACVEPRINRLRLEPNDPTCCRGMLGLGYIGLAGGAVMQVVKAVQGDPPSWGDLAVGAGIAALFISDKRLRKREETSRGEQS